MVIMNAVRCEKPWVRSSSRNVSTKVAPSMRWAAATTRPGQQTQPGPAEPAHQVFGQDCQAFLEGVVSGEPGIEVAQGLGPAVVVGQNVGAHLVLDQRLHPRGRDPRFGADEEVSAGHHETGDVLPYLDPGADCREALPEPRDLLLRSPGELGGVDRPALRGLPSARRDRLQHFDRKLLKTVFHRAVELDAAGQETRGVAILEHGDLAVDLVELLAEDHARAGSSMRSTGAW